MHPLRKKRLLIVLFIVIFSSIGVGLLVFALRENLNLFYPPAEVASGKAPQHKTIRVGGYVVKGSVQREGEGLQLRFRLSDGWAETTVLYTGILPDLFSEGEAAVAKGKLNNNNDLEATEVLAKHDETYTPPEVSGTAVKPH